YSSGHYDFDQQFMYMLLPDAQALLRQQGMISGWQVWVKELDDSQSLATVFKNLFPDLKVEHWSVFNAALFSSLKLEQFAMGLILAIALLMAMLNLIITLMMHVTAKRKNIGVLRALGASEKQVGRIFLWQGVWLGLAGLALAAILVTAFVLALKYIPAF